MISFSAIDLDKSFEELIAIPEVQSWRYSRYDGKQSFTAAEFVATALQKLGIFGDIELNPAEFTTRDIYQLAIYEDEEQVLDQCMESDYALKYCQLFGTYRLFLPGYNSVHPYENMN